MKRIDHVTIHARDIQALGRQQLSNHNVEFGGALVGTVLGTRLMVDQIIPMGVGANPGSHQFDIDQKLVRETSKKVEESGKTFWGYAHTHGPKVANDSPSPEDYQM